MSKALENTSPARGSVEPFSAMRQEMERLFNQFAESFQRPQFNLLDKSWDKIWSTADMAVDVSEDDKGYTITAELPGISEKDIKVRLSNNVLSIKAEKDQEKEEKNKSHYVRERAYGVFQRSFSMPSGVNADKIEAKFANGVLTLVLPKSEDAAKIQKIEVKTAA